MDIKYSKDNLTLGGSANDFRHTLTNLLDSASLKKCWKATGVSFESDEQQENFKFSLSVVSGDPEVVFADVDNVILRMKENGWDFECEKVSSGGYIEIVFGDAKYLKDQKQSSNLEKVTKDLSDGTRIYKLNDEQIYFAKLSDLDGLISHEKYELVKAEFLGAMKLKIPGSRSSEIVADEQSVRTMFDLYTTVGKSNKTLTDAVQEVKAMNQNLSSIILK